MKELKALPAAVRTFGAFVFRAALPCICPLEGKGRGQRVCMFCSRPSQVLVMTWEKATALEIDPYLATAMRPARPPAIRGRSALRIVACRCRRVVRRETLGAVALSGLGGRNRAGSEQNGPGSSAPRG